MKTANKIIINAFLLNLIIYSLFTLMNNYINISYINYFIENEFSNNQVLKTLLIDCVDILYYLPILIITFLYLKINVYENNNINIKKLSKPIKLKDATTFVIINVILDFLISVLLITLVILLFKNKIKNFEIEISKMSYEAKDFEKFLVVINNGNIIEIAIKTLKIIIVWFFFTALYEEFLFRNLFFKNFLSIFQDKIILYNSLFFSLLHFNTSISSVFYSFVLSIIVYAPSYYIFSSTKFNSFLHFLSNIITVFIPYFFGLRIYRILKSSYYVKNHINIIFIISIFIFLSFFLIFVIKFYKKKYNIKIF